MDYNLQFEIVTIEVPTFNSSDVTENIETFIQTIDIVNPGIPIVLKSESLVCVLAHTLSFLVVVCVMSCRCVVSIIPSTKFSGKKVPSIHS